MRLLMFRRDDVKRLGVLAPPADGASRRDEPQTFDVVDVADVALRLGEPFPFSDLLAVIRGGSGALRELSRILEAGARAGGPLPTVTVAHIDMLAPLAPPAGNVIAIGRNYAEHVGEMARVRDPEPDRPTVFTKAQHSVNSPFSEIAIDAKVSVQVDWEAELGVIVGKPALNVPREESMEHVFGYTVINDVSARDLQYGWGGQYFKGKSIDGYCPSGPWVVTADEVHDPHDLEISLSVNGELKQHGNTRDMIFDVPELISQLSLGMTLSPGTLIATGTPPGVGYARDPKEFLAPGDLMETEIKGIGILRNRVVASEGGVWEVPRQPGG